MKNIPKSMFYVTLLLTLVVFAVDANPRPLRKSALDLIVLHNNDMHARFEQTNKISTNCHPDEVLANKCYGGFARVSQVVKDYRRQAENGGPSVLYLNAGDSYTGTPWFTIFKQKIVTAFMNILKPDAMSLGNHEFDLGIKGLVPFLNDVTFPVVFANLENSKDHPLFKTRALKKSTVLDVKGYKIGVIGYLTPDTKHAAAPSDLEFIPEIDAINKEAQKLKNAGVKIIFALGHSGYIVDKEIAKKCPLVDVVIGGHSHSFLYTGEQPDIDTIVGPYPTVIVQDSGKEVPVVQAYAFTKYMGKLELSFDEDGNLVKWSGLPILLDGSVESDPEVLELLEEYRPEVVELTESPIGLTKVNLKGFGCRQFECNLGNLITDAMVYASAKQFKGKRWTDAPIALAHGGGIRASLMAGNITKFDLKSILPFDHTRLVMNVTGHVLKKALEHSVANYKSGTSAAFLQMSGLRVTFDVSRPAGDRATSIYALCSDCDIPSYEKFDVNRVYGVNLSSFMYEGGDGFDMFKEFKGEKMALTEYDLVQNYVEQIGLLYPMVEDRITINDGEIN